MFGLSFDCVLKPFGFVTTCITLMTTKWQRNGIASKVDIEQSPEMKCPPAEAITVEAPKTIQMSCDVAQKPLSTQHAPPDPADSRPKRPFYRRQMLSFTGPETTLASGLEPSHSPNDAELTDGSTLEETCGACNAQNVSGATCESSSWRIRPDPTHQGENPKRRRKLWNRNGIRWFMTRTHLLGLVHLTTIRDCRVAASTGCMSPK